LLGKGPMEHASKRARSPYLDRVWETSTWSSPPRSARLPMRLPTVRTNRATAAALLVPSAAHGQAVARGCGRPQGSLGRSWSLYPGSRWPQPFLQPRAPDSDMVLSVCGLLCSVNDAVNVLPCSTCAYLNARLS
jgi:hypothetical protein